MEDTVLWFEEVDAYLEHALPRKLSVLALKMISEILLSNDVETIIVEALLRYIGRMVRLLEREGKATASGRQGDNNGLKYDPLSKVCSRKCFS